MIRAIVLSLLGLLLLVGGLAGVKTLQIMTLVSASESMSPPLTSVTATEVAADKWERTLSSIGTLESAQGVMITADYAGRVSKLHFDGGETVSAGTLLLEQETSSESAQFAAAASESRLAQQNLARIAKLYDSRVVSRAELDTARSAAQAARAQLDNISATLDKKQILAPFDGRLGLRRVDIGQDLSPGVAIVSLQSIEPMRVNFSLPQSALAELSTGAAVRLRADIAPDETFNATVSAIDTEVDDTTRTVRLQATLDAAQNGASKLLPGMYVTAEVVLPTTRDVLMIPQSAIAFATYGDSVFVLEQDENDVLTARQQFVQLGTRRGDFVEVLKGLVVNDQIANDGVFKLRNGAAVKIVEGSTTPALEPAPDNG